MQRTGWLALVAVCALAGVTVFVSAMRGESAGERGEDRVVTAKPAARGPAVPDVAEDVPLAPVAAEARAASAAPAAENEVLPPPGEPPGDGRLRILGLVLDDETDRPVDGTGATVSVRIESPWGHELIPLGRADVGANGRFWLDVAAPRRDEFGTDHRLEVMFAGPGYELEDADIAVSEFESGVATVTLHASTGARLARGRIVDSRLQPVSGATVQGVQWGPLGSSPDATDDCYWTTADGWFDAEITSIGWVDVLAYHPQFGLAKASGRLEPGQRTLELGDIVLEEQGVIAGTVRGLDGTPIAAYPVEVTPYEGDEAVGDAQRVISDVQGRFRFAHLARGPYRVGPVPRPPGLDDREVVTPDVRDFVVRVRRPSATVTVLDDSGRPVDPASLSVGPPIGDELLSLYAESARGVDVERAERGRYSLLFPDSGTYGVFAADERDGVAWYADATIAAGATHVETTLQLERRPLAAVRFRLTGVRGEEVETWRAEVLDPVSRMRVARASSRSGITFVPPGTWLVRVRPGRESNLVVFEQEVEVVEASTRNPHGIELVARELGGRLEIEIRDAEYRVGLVQLSLRHLERADVQIRYPSWTANRGPVGLFEVLAPGEHVVVARRLDDVPSGSPSEVEAEFEIVPGRTAQVVLTFP
ncbi:MAG: carboxypeptidase-like regulatory domain-containing protein [Planctomycetota bacterium]